MHLKGSLYWGFIAVRVIFSNIQARAIRGIQFTSSVWEVALTSARPFTAKKKSHHIYCIIWWLLIRQVQHLKSRPPQFHYHDNLTVPPQKSDFWNISRSPDKEMNVRPSFVEANLLAGAPHPLFSPHARTVILYSIQGKRFSHIAVVCVPSMAQLWTASCEPTAVTL